jgi:hypothetical protein
MLRASGVAPVAQEPVAKPSGLDKLRAKFKPTGKGKGPKKPKANPLAGMFKR